MIGILALILLVWFFIRRSRKAKVSRELLSFQTVPAPIPHTTAWSAAPVSVPGPPVPVPVDTSPRVGDVRNFDAKGLAYLTSGQVGSALPSSPKFTRQLEPASEAGPSSSSLAVHNVSIPEIPSSESPGTERRRRSTDSAASAAPSYRTDA